MLPVEMPRLVQGPVVLRAFEDRDAALVQSVAADPLIPLVTTVPTSGALQDALAFVGRQHDRLTSGAGYSFAIADAQTDEAVGQIGLWLKDIEKGHATTGYWVAPRYRRRGYVAAALGAVTQWALSLEEVHRLQLYVEPWNEGSWGAAEQCGYQREGLLRSWEKVGDERKDMYVYAVVKAPGRTSSPSPAATKP